MQLTVLKSDGSQEVYRHTKVLGTIAAALSDSGTYKPIVAEELAEAVTLYLRHHYGNGRVAFDEIYAMLQAVLTDTGYERAALALHNYHVHRQLSRSRIEVIPSSSLRRNAHPAKPLHVAGSSSGVVMSSPWNKSIVAGDLAREQGMDYDLARSVAAVVEELVIRMDCRRVTTGMIRELVEQETRTILSAMESMEVGWTAASDDFTADGEELPVVAAAV